MGLNRLANYFLVEAYQNKRQTLRAIPHSGHVVRLPHVELLSQPF
jgi:hypothetical protein